MGYGADNLFKIFFYWCFFFFSLSTHGKSPLNHHLGRIVLKLFPGIKQANASLRVGGVNQKNKLMQGKVVFCLTFCI